MKQTKFSRKFVSENFVIFAKISQKFSTFSLNFRFRENRIMHFRPNSTPDWGWGRSALFLPLADKQTVRTLSKMVKKPQRSLLWLPVMFWITPFHLLVKRFDHPSGRLLESCRSLWRMAWTILADTSWAWASFMTLSWRSFSTSSAIPAMDTVAVRFLWSAAADARSPISPYDNRL